MSTSTRTVLKNVRAWLLKCDAGATFTPSEAARLMAMGGVIASSGAACQVLKELVAMGRAVKVPGTMRGLYRIQDPPGRQDPIVRPLITLQPALDIPPHVKAQVEAIDALHEALDQLQRAFLLPYRTPQKAEARG